MLIFQVNFMGMEGLPEPRKVTAKIRYSHAGSLCTISMQENGMVLCEFEEPVRASTPGQAVVFYEGEYVLGGGTIVK